MSSSSLGSTVNSSSEGSSSPNSCGVGRGSRSNASDLAKSPEEISRRMNSRSNLYTGDMYDACHTMTYDH